MYGVFPHKVHSSALVWFNLLFSHFLDPFEYMFDCVYVCAQFSHCLFVTLAKCITVYLIIISACIKVILMI